MAAVDWQQSIVNADALYNKGWSDGGHIGRCGRGSVLRSLFLLRSVLVVWTYSRGDMAFGSIFGAEI